MNDTPEENPGKNDVYLSADEVERERAQDDARTYTYWRTPRERGHPDVARGGRFRIDDQDKVDVHVSGDIGGEWCACPSMSAAIVRRVGYKVDNAYICIHGHVDIRTAKTDAEAAEMLAAHAPECAQEVAPACEYFRGCAGDAYRIYDGKVALWYPSAQRWASPRNSPDGVRGYCTPVPTEHEAIHGVPETVEDMELSGADVIDRLETEAKVKLVTCPYCMATVAKPATGDTLTCACGATCVGGQVGTRHWEKMAMREADDAGTCKTERMALLAQFTAAALTGVALSMRKDDADIASEAVRIGKATLVAFESETLDA